MEKQNNHQKRDKIVIDISSLDPKSIKENRFIQKDAFEEVVDILKGDLNNKISKNVNIHDVRAHNTIFLNGKRGSGKTQFLLGIEEYLQKNTDIKGLYFFNPIDPTLLHDNESFLTIIIAKILNNLERYKKIYTTAEKQKYFYKTLNDLSGAIDGIVHKGYEKKSALENIAQDQTSLQLEEYMHQFFKLVTKMLHKKRVVLLIDDVDMAFEKGFKVLEVVRKYLSSPYVIPIVTGDLELYQVIVENNFIKKLDDKLKEDNKERNQKVAIDYLIKVLPTHRRVRVKTLYELSQNRDIKFLYKDRNSQINEFLLICSSCNKDDKKVKYFRNYAFEIFEIKLASNKFIENLFSNNLRNIIQFLHKNILKIETLKKENKLSDININKIKKIENNYQLCLLDNVFTCDMYYAEALNNFHKPDYDKTVELTNKCLDLPPKNEKIEYKTLILKGKALYALKNNYDVISVCERAVKIESHIKLNDYEAYFILGNVYADIEVFFEAEEYYKEALRRDENRIEILRQLATLYYDNKYYNEALKYYLKVKRLDEGDCNLLHRLGLCYAKLGKNKEAITNYESSYECKQTYTVYLCLLELYMIESNEKYISYVKDFLNQYGENINIMKIFDMIDILYRFSSMPSSIKSSDMLRSKLSFETIYMNWYNKYKDVLPALEWQFTEIDLWLEGMKNSEKKHLLSKYVNKFKDALNNVKK